MRAQLRNSAVALLCLGCDSFVGSYEVVGQGEQDAGGAPSVDSSELCEIERSAFIFPLDLASRAQETSLEAYYERANPELIEHLNAVGEAYRRGMTQARATYVQGAAGVGKSFVTRNSFSAFDDDEQCTVALAGVIEREAAQLQLDVAPMPDLETLDRELVFNQLPGLVRPSELDLGQLLEVAGCAVEGALVPLVVLDGIDELHDDTSHALLQAVDEFLMDRSDEEWFVHVVVAGRPEGFSSWLSDPRRTEEHNAIVDSFHLRAPQYHTAGDLEFRLRSYLEFAGQFDELDDSGDFDEYLQSFTQALERHQFLPYSVGNLAVGNVVIQHTAPELDEGEQTLKAGLFDDIVVRNAQSHGRPGDGAPLESPYRRALEDVAAMYAEVSQDGVFAVRSEDTVEVYDDDGRSLGEVRVRNLLNRGGVAFLTSATTTTTRYRFDPFWLHAHLVERHNRRVDLDYSYQGCD